MKVWTITGFTGHHPVGTAAVVVANSPEHAAEMLNAHLEDRNLPRSAQPKDFVQLRTGLATARILCDGDY